MKEDIPDPEEHPEFDDGRGERIAALEMAVEEAKTEVILAEATVRETRAEVVKAKLEAQAAQQQIAIHEAQLQGNEAHAGLMRYKLKVAKRELAKGRKEEE